MEKISKILMIIGFLMVVCGCSTEQENLIITLGAIGLIFMYLGNWLYERSEIMINVGDTVKFNDGIYTVRDTYVNKYDREVAILDTEVDDKIVSVKAYVSELELIDLAKINEELEDTITIDRKEFRRVVASLAGRNTVMLIDLGYKIEAELFGEE